MAVNAKLLGILTSSIAGEVFGSINQQAERKSKERMQINEMNRQRQERQHEYEIKRLDCIDKEKERQQALNLARLARTGNLQLAMIDASVQLGIKSFQTFGEIKRIKAETENLRIQAEAHIQSMQIKSNENIAIINKRSDENIKLIETVYLTYINSLQAHQNMSSLLVENQKNNSEAMQTIIQYLASPNLSNEDKEYYKETLDQLRHERTQIQNQILGNAKIIGQIQMQDPKLQSLDLNTDNTNQDYDAIEMNNPSLLNQR